VNTETTEDIYKLKPGWIQISKTDGQIVIIDNSTSTKQEITNLNCEMDNVIQKLQQNWLKHKVNYDSIHGKGAYDDLHYLTPIYGSDLDDDDNYDDITDDDSDDLYKNPHYDN
jgi:hypothetical protein